MELELDKSINQCKIFLGLAKEQGDERRVNILSDQLRFFEVLKKHTYGADKPANTEYPQSAEENEYRFIDPKWLDGIAIGLTAGAKNHPGETWHSIPADEHAARAMRHINMYRNGDRSDNHLINASMRLMMAHVMDQEADT